MRIDGAGARYGIIKTPHCGISPRKGFVTLQLEGKSLRSDFARFVTATALSLTIFSLYAMVDGLFVARGVSEYAMSAVNLAIPIINGLFSLAVLFAVGTSTIIAVWLGQGKRAEANRLFSQDIAVLLALGLCITAAILLFTDPLARLLGATKETAAFLHAYLRGLAPFASCYMISYNLEILVRTDGFPRFATVTVICGCLFHALMDYLTIFVWKWGIVGAAISSGSSQLLTCLVYIIHFLGKKSTFRFTRFRFDRKIYRRLLPLGISDGLTELCTGVMIFLFNRTLLRHIGADGVVSYTIIAYVNTIVINLMMGVGQGSQPLVSYHRGKGEPEACKKLLRYGLATVAALAVVSFAGLWFFAPQVVRAYLPDSTAALRDYSVFAFRRYSFSYLLVGFNVFIAAYLTAQERPKEAIAVSVGRGLILQAGALLLLAEALGGGAVWFTPVLSEAACLGLSLFFLRRWLKSE